MVDIARLTRFSDHPYGGYYYDCANPAYSREATALVYDRFGGRYELISYGSQVPQQTDTTRHLDLTICLQVTQPVKSLARRTPAVQLRRLWHPAETSFHVVCREWLDALGVVSLTQVNRRVSPGVPRPNRPERGASGRRPFVGFWSPARLSPKSSGQAACSTSTFGALIYLARRYSPRDLACLSMR